MKHFPSHYVMSLTILIALLCGVLAMPSSTFADKKSSAKKPAAKKADTKKSAAKKTDSKKGGSKKESVKKPAAKKAAEKLAAAKAELKKTEKKIAAAKAAAKKTAAKNSSKEPDKKAVAKAPLSPIITPVSPQKKGKPLSDYDKKRVERRNVYAYALYRDALEHKERFFRCIAIVGMNKVDAKETLEPIHQTALKDKDPLVRAMAFQAMLPRMKDLTKEQHADLIEKALDDAMKNYLRGELRVGLFQHLTCFKPDAFDGKAAKSVYTILSRADHKDPTDTRMLIAIRQLVAHWKDETLIRNCIRGLGRDGTANKFEYVLGGLAKITAVGNVNKPGDWLKAQRAWREYADKASFKSKPCADYKTVKTWFLLPAPRKILDPNNPEWNENLELGKLTVEQFDLAFVMDATGSMGGPMKWIASNLGSLMTMTGLICPDPRIGVTLFRHETNHTIQSKCCKTFKVNHKTRPAPVFGCKKLYSLSSNTTAMAAGLAGFQPHSGNFLHPGCAIAGGLESALSQQPWSKAESAKKLIILVGDSSSTFVGTKEERNSNKSTQLACKIAKNAKKKGFVIHSLRLKGASEDFQKVATAGGGNILGDG